MKNSVITGYVNADRFDSKTSEEEMANLNRLLSSIKNGFEHNAVVFA